MNGRKVQRFQAHAVRRPAGGAIIPLPFDPAAVWGRRDRYHVTGNIEGVRYRTALVHRQGGWQIVLAPKSGSAAGLRDGQRVSVEMWPEGPQLDELASDIARALAASPKAETAFEALAQFYRKGWLRWIDATKRRPELRAERITEMVRLLESGHKERPS
ncbi:MAG TPA: YdeI/OmpD-associated family protein [Candidatus Dormibacteraeota bacterium]|nr:YdeI/OmpD-associated family protein [Candidatus Dormibacteraeota bacterium]